MRAAAARYVTARSEHPVRFYLLTSLVLFFLLMLAMFLRPRIISHLQAMAVMKQVGGQPLPAVLKWAVVEPVTQRDLTLQTDAGTVRARMYMPMHHRMRRGWWSSTACIISASMSRA
jgi:hypothetical protein